jgi:hypothetical protein
MRTFVAVIIGGLITAACAESLSGGGDIVPAASSAEPSTCPVTVPARAGFVPPEPYPPEPPFEEVWYGTPDLWTNLDPHGQVWSDLPLGKDGSVGDKTLWWSENFSTAANEDFTGNADIHLTAVRLDGPAATVVEKHGVPSFNRDIGNFMLVGLVLPKPGCWEVRARYEGAELAYVLRVER